MVGIEEDALEVYGFPGCKLFGGGLAGADRFLVYQATNSARTHRRFALAAHHDSAHDSARRPLLVGSCNPPIFGPLEERSQLRLFRASFGSGHSHAGKFSFYRTG